MSTGLIIEVSPGGSGCSLLVVAEDFGCFDHWPIIGEFILANRPRGSSLAPVSQLCLLGLNFKFLL